MQKQREQIKDFQHFLNELNPIGKIKVTGRLDDDTLYWSEYLSMPFVRWFKMSEDERKEIIALNKNN